MLSENYSYLNDPGYCYFTGKKIFIFSPQQWSNMRLSKHHYATTLAESGNHVYFIEPARKGGAGVEIKKISDNLSIVNYPLLARGWGKLPGFIYRLLVHREVNLLIRSTTVEPDVVWSFDPLKIDHLHFFKKAKKIYHPVDQFDNKFINDSIKDINYCFSTIPAEVEKLRSMGLPAAFINHGLSKAFISFSKSRLKNLSELSSRNKKNLDIGFAGNLGGEAPDRNAMQKVILQNSDCIFHFWGQYEKPDSYIDLGFYNPEFITFLKSRPNVRLYGAVSSEVLALAMQGMDLFWICWNTTGSSTWNSQTNPHKIIEYLSTGRPVISHFIECYKDTGLLTMDADDRGNETYPEMFKAEVARCRECSEEYILMQINRIEFALNNTYQQQVSRVGHYISKS